MTDIEIKFLKEKYNFELIETHISWVLLGEDYVYKIKKPVDFGFLDYTTLDKRLEFCKKEVELNKRLADEIYLGVSRIVKKNNELLIDEDGETVEYAVKMKKMPQNRMMDVLIENNKIELSYIDALALKIANFHKTARTDEYISSFGSVEANKFNTDENFSQTKDGVGEYITQFQYDAIRQYTDEFYEINAELFEKRIREKKVRDCHGDMYSKNICIIDREHIYVYDCIEFNERFRYSDVASDVAFLLMDLENYGKWELSETFLNAYLNYSADKSMAEVLDFYKVYRAYVRGKIAFFQSNAFEANRYFDLAFGYLPQKYKPTVIVMCGLTGSGKSFIAEHLKEKFNFEHLNTDIIRKELAGIDPHQKVIVDYNSDIYSQNFSKKVYEEMVNRAYNFVREGRGVILDGTFLMESYRKKVFDRFRRLGIKPVVVCVEIEKNEAIKHFEQRKKQKSVSDGRLEIFEKQKEIFQKPKEAIFVNGSWSIDEIMNEIESSLGGGV